MSEPEDMRAESADPGALGAAPSLDRAALLPYVGERFHPARSSGQADLYYLRAPFEGWVLKDFSARPFGARFLHRHIMSREARALRALADMPGVPRLAGRVGKYAIVMERLRAVRLPRERDGAPSVEAFARIRALVGEMHRRGWTHGDLRRKNILIGEREQPYLIDFATAFHAGRKAGLLKRWLFRRLERVDLVSLARIKESYCPDNLTGEERELLAAAPWYLRLGRWFRRRFYHPVKEQRKQMARAEKDHAMREEQD